MRTACVSLFLLAMLPFFCNAECPNPNSAQASWQQALLQVDMYRNTYVMIYPDRVVAHFPAFGPSTSAESKIGAITGTAMDLARKAGITDVAEIASAADPGGIVRDLQTGKLDAVVVWAPLAGWMLDKWDTNHELNMRASNEAGAAPENFTKSTAQPQNPAGINACSDAVRVVLESYGVVPAEKSKLNIYEVLSWQTPNANEREAHDGRAWYQQFCASCHGKNAVMAKALAPVNLLNSLPKFTYGGFSYITLKGRNIKGMPGYHGILEDEQLQKIYQYLRARSNGRLSD
jgi:mono/diheme cytochrome c family protein